jgi:hypothetical protein
MPVNGAEVTSQMQVIESTEWGAPLRYALAYNVRVWLEGDSQASLSRAELAFRAALMQRDKDFILYTDSGARSSACILVRDTASGTRVVNIGTPEAQGGEFVNRRTVTFTVVAEYHVNDAANAVVSWRESLTIIGNGKARRVWRFPINGPAIRQTIAPASLVRAIQQGQAIGYLKRPKKSRLLFPDYLVHDQVQETSESPRFMGVGFDMVDYPVSWQYVFERGDGPLVGVPNLPPGVIT